MRFLKKAMCILPVFLVGYPASGAESSFPKATIRYGQFDPNIGGADWGVWSKPRQPLSCKDLGTETIYFYCRYSTEKGLVQFHVGSKNPTPMRVTLSNLIFKSHGGEEIRLPNQAATIPVSAAGDHWAYYFPAFSKVLPRGGDVFGEVTVAAAGNVTAEEVKPAASTPKPSNNAEAKPVPQSVSKPAGASGKAEFWSGNNSPGSDQGSNQPASNRQKDTSGSDASFWSGKNPNPANRPADKDTGFWSRGGKKQ